MNDIEKRIEELTKELNYHNHKYYVEDAPEISDFEFDAMLVELEQLEDKYPEYKSQIHLQPALEVKLSKALQRCAMMYLC